MAPKASKNKTEDEYKLPDKIPEGTILTTIAKKQLRVGKSIGKQLAMIPCKERQLKKCMHGLALLVIPK